MENRFTGAMLDDQQRYASLDPDNMTGLIEGLPDQAREAVDIARAAELPKFDGIRNIVILGMGGSAIGGNLVRSLYEDELPVPVNVVSDYTLPAYVDEDTLVIASSYSGNTEESLTTYDEAVRRGAKAVVISTGGEIGRRAQEHGHPWIRIKAGMQPRAAIGMSLFPLIVILNRLGFIADVDDDVDEAIEILEKKKAELNSQVPFEHNPMKQLALACAGKIPLVYGSGGWRGVAAYRWKTQVNENSKALCFSNAFPELNHNETVGWEYPELTREFHVIMLRDPADTERMNTRVEVTKSIMAERIAGQTEVWAEGESKLARLVSLIYPGDYFSLYLALLYGVDPTPVRMIDRLKGELAKLDE